MNTILSLTLMWSLLCALQVIAPVPDAQIRLLPFYLSSEQKEPRLKLSSPAAIAVARSGNVFAFDDGNSRIVKLNAAGKFIGEFGQPGSGPGAVNRGGLIDSLAVDESENVYVSDSTTPGVSIFSSDGKFQRSFRVPFPITSIAVNRKREILLTIDTARPASLVYVFSDTGKFLRRFGDRLLRPSEGIPRLLNRAIIACDSNDNPFVAFRSWPVIRKYSPEGTLIGENQFKIPSELISDSERKTYSLEFFSEHPDSSFIPPLITHSISINARGTGYLLLNAHSIVIFANSGKVTRQFHFSAPRGRDNLFVRLAASFNSNAPAYLLDAHSGEVYKALRF